MPVFATPAGVVVPVVTADQMKEIDRIAIEETGPLLPQMMENAGRNLAIHVMSLLGDDWREKSITVLAGTGGNGGGGICSARHLANRGGDVFVAVTDEKRLRPVPRQQLDIYRHAGGRVGTADDVMSTNPTLIVDALVGYSLGGPPRGIVKDLVTWAGETESPVVSLDIPSGIDATTGETPGVHVTAASTVTLALPKTGLGVVPGELWLADLGIPADTYARAGIEVSARLFGDEFLIRLERA